MLVLTDEKSSRRQPDVRRPLSFEQRFAIGVLSVFAVALMLFGVLFARSGDAVPGATDVTGLASRDGAAASAVAGP